MKLVFLLSFCIFGSLAESNITYQEAQTKIAGGFGANIENYPFQVSLQVRQKGKYGHFCGGVILNQEWVLTAAHCIAIVKGSLRDSFKILAGTTDLREADKGQSAKVAQSFIHPKYKGGIGPNDIGLLKLTTKLTINDKVKEAKLPAPESNPPLFVYLSGWGSTRYFLNQFIPNTPVKLRQRKYLILNKYLCFLRMGWKLSFQANICTVGILSSACSGDSGGPLSTKDGTVVGLVSWGIVFCGTAPSVYTKVSHYIPYITEIIQNN